MVGSCVGVDDRVLTCEARCELVGVFVKDFWDLLLLLSSDLARRLLLLLFVPEIDTQLYIGLKIGESACCCYWLLLHIIENHQKPGTLDSVQQEDLRWFLTGLEEVVIVVRGIYRRDWRLENLDAACCRLKPPRNYKELLLSVAWGLFFDWVNLVKGVIGVILREKNCDILISLARFVLVIVRGTYIRLEIGESGALLL